MLNKSGIDGKSLNDLKSDLFLKYVGLGIESRTALINNINRVVGGMNNDHIQTIHYSKKAEHRQNDCDDDAKTEIV